MRSEPPERVLVTTTSPKEKGIDNTGDARAKVDVKGGAGPADPEAGPGIEGAAVGQLSALGWVVYAAQPTVVTLPEV